jgi:hypothetical protein
MVIVLLGGVKLDPNNDQVYWRQVAMREGCGMIIGRQLDGNISSQAKNSTAPTFRFSGDQLKRETI